MSIVYIVSFIGWILSYGWWVFNIAKKKEFISTGNTYVGICKYYVYNKMIYIGRCRAALEERKYMTNHEWFSKITGKEKPLKIEAIEMLLSRILEDYRSGLFKQNYPKYLKIYRGMVEWLNSEV